MYVAASKRTLTRLRKCNRGTAEKLEMLQMRSPCIVFFFPAWAHMKCFWMHGGFSSSFGPAVSRIGGACVRASKRDGAISLACQPPSVSNAVGKHPVEPVEQFLLHRSTTHLMAHGARVISPEQDPTRHVSQLRSGCYCTASVQMW